MLIDCGSVVKQKGYQFDIFHWTKPDLVGKSHGGGARQAVSVEWILVVYKHHDVNAKTRAQHYALLHYRDVLKPVR